MIEEGSWKARAREGCLATAGTGREQLAIGFEILEGPNAGEWITGYFYFHNETSFRIAIESLRTCGWQGTDLTDLTGIDANEVRVVVAHEDYNGEVREKVKWVNPLGGVVVQNRMDAGTARQFANELRGRILAMGSGGGQRPTGRTTEAQRPQIDDDIPF